MHTWALVRTHTHTYTHTHTHTPVTHKNIHTMIIVIVKYLLNANLKNRA